MTKLIAATTLILMLTSAADAEVPLLWRDGVAIPCPQCVVRPTLGWRPVTELPAGIMVGASNPTVYESRSQTVIRSNYGTSVIYRRSYSR
jgi:hypothetical protein